LPAPRVPCEARAVATRKKKTSPAKKRGASKAKPAKSKGKSKNKPSQLRKGKNGVVLLSGGNPQIPKGDGDAPVKAYIAALPGWKSPLGKRLDALIMKNAPNAHKAVKWNSPFYGVEGHGWVISFHAFTRYMKVTFFKGAALEPVPPGPSKDKNVRYLDIHEGEELDEKQFASWVKQAASMPGWIP
jgi:hypothetical protein